MSQPPPLQYQSPSGVASQTNVLGLIGFIFVMIGLIGFCVPPAYFMGLVGTVLCGIAVFKRPRGLAIAGLTVGILEMLVALFVLVVLGIIIASGANTAAQQLKVRAGVDHAAAISLEIDRFKREHDRLPGTLRDLPALADNADDGFGKPIRYVPNTVNGSYKLMSNGWDGLPNTVDDFTLTDTSITPYSTMQIPSMPAARKPASVPAFPKEPDGPK